ncbi:MAG: COX15/CtaA family protein, partial [Burkholderiales bacterium]|nr:COX15/CtaA family protein [Burkholderiales bacterium]
MDPVALVRMALTALVIALMPLSWLWLRQRGADRRARLAALTALALFLTFDLVMFGSFTRLSDSGLGCPDWPGCYGHSSPIGAALDIHAAHSAMPEGPVSWGKAWIEMVHRYLAMTVGVLLIVLAAASVALRRGLPHSLLWPFATLGWVVVQGLFGKYTVTLKLYPAVVTAHLIGGLVLLALLAVQHEAYRAQRLALAPPLRRLALAASAVLVLQVVLGGWVSTNYAVLACTGFPQCNGQWWPAMDFGAGFTLLRELGRTGAGAYLPFDALVAIQMLHRLVAIAASALLAALAWRLAGVPAAQRFGFGLAALLALQIA